LVRTRIAPSPTGSPHIGTIYSSYLDFAFAKKNKGSFVVRIEDTDRQRFNKEAEEELYQAFEWFGITPNESPKVGGKYSPYRQSERLDLYKKYAKELIDKGYAYYCFCSRKRLEDIRKKMQEKGIPPKYDGYCLKLSHKTLEGNLKANIPHVIRMRVPVNKKIVVKDELRGEIEFDSNIVDDQVLIKSDGYPTYHLAAVVDDHLMKITHVVRGEEWLSSYPKHHLLYKYFRWEIPRIFHTPIIKDMSGSKLSKRHGHTSVDWYKKEGYLPEAVLNFISLLGWSHPQGKEVFSTSEFIKLFNLKDLSSVSPKFDLEKLDWMNGTYIRNLSNDQLITKLKEFDDDMKSIDIKILRKVVPLVKERMRKLSEFQELTDFFFTDELPVTDSDLRKLILKQAKEKPVAKGILNETVKLLSKYKDRHWKDKYLEKELRKMVGDNEWKPKAVFMTIRVVISGKKATPPLFDTLEVLGKEKVLSRLNKASDLLKAS